MEVRDDCFIICGHPKLIYQLCHLPIAHWLISSQDIPDTREIRCCVTCPQPQRTSTLNIPYLLQKMQSISIFPGLFKNVSQP